MSDKTSSIALLLIAEVAAMSLWFVSAAILPEMVREVDVSPFAQAALSSGVQLGFVAGALVFAVLGLADRFDPRHVFAVCAVLAGVVTLTLIVSAPGGASAILARFVTGALLAGVYPVGMKIAVGWGETDRGLLVGLLVGALTLGSASPHLLSLAGGAEWRTTVAIAAAAAMASGVLALFVGIGPHHAKAARFNPATVFVAWTNRRVRLAIAGYLGHMFELYAMWAWIAVAAAASFAVTMAPDDAEVLAKLTAFIAIASGGVACVAAGFAADRIGKANVTIMAMAASGAAAVATAVTFGGPAWVTILFVVIWGVAIIPDSAQFSALVADAAPPEAAGSLMTLQTALGFALTFITVQATPVLAELLGWPVVLASLALGPVFGIAAMWRLKAMDRR